MAPAPLFEIRGLTIEVASRQGGTPLIEDVNLILRPGESIGVVGETGAGKSLSILASVGLLPVGVRPTGGTVSFNGASLPVTRPQTLTRATRAWDRVALSECPGCPKPFHACSLPDRPRPAAAPRTPGHTQGPGDRSDGLGRPLVPGTGAQICPPDQWRPGSTCGHGLRPGCRSPAVDRG